MRVAVTSDFAPGGTQVRHEGGRASLVAHRLRLAAVEGPDQGSSWDVPKPRAVVGSAPTCDVVLRDPQVSRQHCEISVRDDGYVLRDLDSTNGTFSGEVRVVEGIIAPGSQLGLGSTVLLFEPRKKWVRLSQSQTQAFGGLIGGSAVMRSVFGALERIGPTRLSVVLRGETGTGKELAARGLHAVSARARGPFVVFDCAAVTEHLVAAELFGHERGAFTGADRARAGAFELADGGTLFLDEMGDLPLTLQPQLLRVLERREIKRLGAEQPLDVDVRVVCATHHNLEQLVAKGGFRDDLYFRLAEVEVKLPPLREHLEDVPLLVERILAEEARHGSKVQRLSAAAMELLQSRTWPGNVRELRNVVRRAVALAAGEVVEVEHLGHATGRTADVTSPGLSSSVGGNLPDELAALELRAAREQWNAEFERRYLARVLARCNGDEQRAAEASGVHLKSFQRLLRQHGLRKR